MNEESSPAVTAVSVTDETLSGAEVSLNGEMLGKYQLKRHLATGGMAEIYLAERQGPEGFAKQIVIKRILSHLARDANFTAMFLDEARLAANLNHPNIGQIHELGEDNGNYFIAMEFIDGVSLDQLIASDVPIPSDVAARIITDVLQALDFAHESRGLDGQPLGLVHRDVTPSNIMVSVDGIVKLVDFGVAKAAKKGHKTETGAVKGKFAYMAPEQVESQDIDRRADIFAIGIVFYELLTGTRPFGEDLAAVSRILHEEAKDPRELDPSIPEPFSRVVMRSLQKNPDERYPTAHNMLLDVETALRLQNSYAGPREVASVVRALRGEGQSGPVPVRAEDTGVFAADRSAEIPAASMSAELLGVMQTASIEPEPEKQRAKVETAVAAPPKQKAPPSEQSTKLMRRVGAGVVGLVVLSTAAAIGATAFGGESTSDLVTAEPRTVVLNTQALVAENAEPDALFEEGGKIVVIGSIPSTKIYKGGKFVGWTPHQTRLSPGSYRIELELDDTRKKADFEVADAGVSRVEFRYASLGEKEDAPTSKRKKRRRSLGSKIRGLF